MTLDELIHKRLTSREYFRETLAAYGEQPAVFYQIAPNDVQKGWRGEQYPRIVYTIDMQADQERKIAGVMQVDLYCDESKTVPEDIAPHIRECLENLIVKPDGNSYYAFAWARTEMFTLQASGRDRGVATRIGGATMRFDILEYSLQTTSDPDPEQALQYWLKDLEPFGTVIGKDKIESFFEPSGERPAFYVRVMSNKTNRMTFALTWVDCVLTVHVIAPEPEMRNRWAKYLADCLQRDGEILMLDDGLMLIEGVEVENAADYLTRGQITVRAQYSIPRISECVHPLSHITTKEGM